ncbi:unnamed protein product [Victoria cruziana]
MASQSKSKTPGNSFLPFGTSTRLLKPPHPTRLSSAFSMSKRCIAGNFFIFWVSIIFTSFCVSIVSPISWFMPYNISRESSKLSSDHKEKGLVL